MKNDDLKSSLEENPALYSTLCENTRDSEELLLATLKNGKIFYQYASHRLRQKPDIFLDVCFLHYGFNLKYAGENIKSSPSIILQALKNDMFAQYLEYANPVVFQDPELMVYLAVEWPKFFYRYSSHNMTAAQYINVFNLNKSLEEKLPVKDFYSSKKI